MNQVRTLGRAAVDRGLRIARMPINAATQLLPDGRCPRDAAMLVVDRADASVRAIAGNLFNDETLRDDATRRRAAADERERALELHARAKEKARESDGQLAKDLDRAERLRIEAERDAEQARQAVAEKTAAAEARAKKAAAAEERSADQLLEARIGAEEKQAKRRRLEVLDEQADARDQESDALTASDDAQRLAEAAASAKAARKGSA